ncbi:MAG: TatD family hydrolase [Candidatus Kerfeldbacteria bacterium]|nr:TatD family hydrolase [Candidatus Kerfeldbacteria bacterium]
MLTDAHCHLQDEEFSADRDAVIARCTAAGMRCILAGNRADDSIAAAELAERHDGLFAVVGLHPMYVQEEEWEEGVYEQLLQRPKVVGVGEIGLDYYHLWADNDEQERDAKRQQHDLLVRQLDFARSHHKPVVLHCRDAYDDLLDVLRTHAAPRTMIHTFLGNRDQAKEFLDLGCYLSFSGIITFENGGTLAEMVRSVPLNRFMIETDAPLLTPVPNRGKRNEPVNVRNVAERIAEIRACDIEMVISSTARNAAAFFALP